MQIYNDDWLEIRPDFLVYLALLVVFMPFRLILAWLIAAGVHELGHYIPLLIFRIRIIRFTLGFSGAAIHTESMLPWQEFISTLCGPIGGLLLLFASKWFPLVSACALVQSVFNLLPFYPLDGGRLTRLTLDILNVPTKYRRILSCLKRTVIFITIGMLVYFCKDTILIFYTLIFLLVKILRFFFLQTRPTDSKMVGI